MRANGAPIVIDASALIELLLRTPRGDLVLALVETEDMAAPDILDAEVLSALRRLERSGDITTQRAGEAVADLRHAPIHRLPILPLLQEMWRLRSRVSIYDACYVALTTALETALVTADQRLARCRGASDRERH
jgi:predicted nucleic acid-binding protein